MARFYGVLILLTAMLACAQAALAQNPEDDAWRALNRVDKQSLTDFLAQYPAGEHAEEAKLAISLQDILDPMRTGALSPPLVIPEEDLGDVWVNWKSRRRSTGMLGYFANKRGNVIEIGVFAPVGSLSGLTVSFDASGTAVSPTGDGSIIAFKTGGVQYEFLPGIVITTPADETMYFGVIGGVGLAYLKGEGEVTLPGLEPVRLPLTGPITRRAAPIEIGSQAPVPSFQLLGLDDRQHSLDDLLAESQLLLIHFWCVG